MIAPHHPPTAKLLALAYRMAIVSQILQHRHGGVHRTSRNRHSVAIQLKAQVGRHGSRIPDIYSRGRRADHRVVALTRVAAVTAAAATIVLRLIQQLNIASPAAQNAPAGRHRGARKSGCPAVESASAGGRARKINTGQISFYPSKPPLPHPATCFLPTRAVPKKFFLGGGGERAREGEKERRAACELTFRADHSIHPQHQRPDRHNHID